MTHVVALAVLVAADNVPAALGLGALPWCRSRRTRLMLAFWFAVLEGTMPVVGSMIGGAAAGIGPYAEFLPIAALGFAALLVFGGATGQLPLPSLRRTWWLGLLPLSLSFDNLFAGIALGAIGSGPAEAAVVGVISGLLCLTALTTAQHHTARLPDRSRLVTGGALMLGAMLFALA